MLRRLCAAMVSALVLAGCSNASLAPVHAPVRILKTGSMAVASNILLYVAECANGPEVVAFPVDSTGTVAPSLTIRGTNTTLRCPIDVATDPNGNIVVADVSVNGSQNGAIDIFPPGATGNVHPTARIRGSATGITTPISLGVDSLGRIYVVQNTDIVVFTPGSHGDVSPLRIIAGPKTGLEHAVSIGLDTDENVYVADNAVKAISVFSRGSNGNVAPVAFISGSNTGLTDPGPLTVTKKGTIFVQGSDGFTAGPIERFAPGSNGNVAPSATFESSNGRYNVVDLAVRDGYVYVAAIAGFVDVFPSGSSGKVIPREFTSHLFYPAGIGF